MKTLANCSPREFLLQTNRIRKAAEKWLELTQVLEIRKTMPEIRDDMSAEEKRAAFQAQARRNLSRMYEAALERCPGETAELIGLLCFIEPEDLDKHTMKELLGEISNILADEEIIGFFASLAQLVLTAGAGSARR